MGGSQSVRKITIDNNNADVIKVSQSVVERLKSGSRVDSGKNSESKVVEEPKMNVKSSSTPSASPIVSNLVAPYPYYFPGSISVQDEIQKEVDKTNEYWKHRISKLETNQEEMSNKMQAEYDRTMKEFENILPELGAQKGTSLGELSDLSQVKDRLIDCYKNNKNKSLNCAAEVEHFNRCFEQKRISVQRARS